MVAVTDFMKMVPDQVARWVPAPFVPLGTDGYGRSDTSANLRRHFETDAAHVVVAVLDSLARADEAKPEEVADAIARYGLDPEIARPPGALARKWSAPRLGMAGCPGDHELPHRRLRRGGQLPHPPGASFVKRVVEGPDLVPVVGMVHGIIFLIYVILVLKVRASQGWGAGAPSW